MTHSLYLIFLHHLEQKFLSDRLFSFLARELHRDVAKASTEMKNMDLCALVVEDEKLLNWSLAKSLAKWGYEVHPVFTARAAVDEIEHAGFDIILLDYHLPDLDGLEVARRVRARQPSAVIFLVTAFQLNELSVEAGLIDEYFNKPVDLQQLHQALKKLPSRRSSGGSLETPTSYQKKA